MRKRAPAVAFDDDIDAEEIRPAYSGFGAAETGFASAFDTAAELAPPLYAAAVKWADVLEQVTLAEMSGVAGVADYEALATAVSDLHDMVRAERGRLLRHRH